MAGASGMGFGLLGRCFACDVGFQGCEAWEPL